MLMGKVPYTGKLLFNNRNKIIWHKSQMVREVNRQLPVWEVADLGSSGY